MTSIFIKVDDLDEVRNGLVKRDTIYRLISEHKINALRLSKRRLLVQKDRADRLMRTQKEAQTRIHFTLSVQNPQDVCPAIPKY
jgi:hypothetical protein